MSEIILEAGDKNPDSYQAQSHSVIIQDEITGEYLGFSYTESNPHRARKYFNTPSRRDYALEDHPGKKLIFIPWNVITTRTANARH